MTSRERVIASINHKEPDMVPIDFGGTPSSGVNIIAYLNLKKFLGATQGIPKVYDLFQQLALPEEELIKRMQSDVIILHRQKPRFDIPVDSWKEWMLKDGAQCLVPEKFNPLINEKGDLEIIENDTVIARMPANGYYFDIMHNPHKDIETYTDIDKIKFPVLDDFELNYLQNKAKDLYENTEYAIVGSFGGSILETGQRCWGFEKFLVEMALNEELVRYWVEKLTKSHLENLERYLKATGKYINVIQFSDDLGTQQSLMISKTAYRNIIKPYHSILYGYVHKYYPGIKVLLHSCGAIYELIPDLIEAGVDAVNPVQISAEGMNPTRLKREFGKDMIFWGGGMDMQFTVNSGTLEQIEHRVMELMDIFKPGGGFVFAPVHNIQENVQPEKIIAIYDTAIRYRNY